VGLLHTDRGDPESARAMLQKAKQLAPGDAEIAYQYAQSCQDCMRNAEAVAALQGWADWSALTTELVAKIAFLLLALGESQQAVPAVLRVELDPRPSALTRLKLAQIYERTNQLERAGEQLQHLRGMAASHELGQELAITTAQFAERQGRHEEASKAYASAIADCKEFRLCHAHLFPYARSLDALQRYEEAFAALTQAHRSQVEHLSTTVPEALTRRAPTLSITRYSCDASDVAAWQDPEAPSLADSPIFIVAFPRSGTTLLEQSLDAHPLLRSMDEQPFLQNAIDLIMDAKIAYPEGLSRMSAGQLDQVRRVYWELAGGKVQLRTGQRLIDKNPLNLLRLPAIRRLFPNARILLAVRHPCDVVLSCFMQHFTAPEFALLCRDLPTLASGFRQSFDFWYQQAGLLNPPVREVRYETFVTDFDNQIRGVAEFLGVPFDTAMLAPAEHAKRKGFISTPSYSQVVQPVNRRSVDRWRAYEKHFASVLPALQPYLDRWNYMI
jgi:tetratricopeptide (TPR) repeat protein